MVPDRAEGERLELFEERQPRGGIALGLEPAQGLGRLEQGEQERLEHAPRADDPGRHPVDAGVEEVEPDMHPAEVVAPDQLLRDRLQLVGEDHHVVAVPPHAAADVQQDLVEVLEHGRDLVRDDLGRMVVAGVQAQELLARDGVAEVELVRADDVALRADAEQLALDGVAVVLRVDRLGEDRVERIGEPLARPLAVDGTVLGAVGDPDVGDAGGPQGLADRAADPAAGDAVVDPEPPDGRVGVGQGVAVGGQGVGEIRRVEVHADPPGLRPVDPVLEVLGLERVALDLPAAGLGIAGVEVQAMRAGQERQRLVQVGSAARRACGPCRDNCR